ncbi:enoyl-CoA hydratase/isomerase family protein [Leptospira biflexa]|uniref:enoyl-CoA hydratase/isomerase family protein n=1 Tax=Leptospira biflexa TaxID=172 RepID=UPI0010826284|nr:enoyl-CoA hydratase/isomerase family protein [Leptospira biflexa]TGM37803.1 enoyl-CoA hydratase/isomerase family protein [Leptospira biflexa]TGM41137.1 enoyl-CoA hydratase/isomerase family protein [Leptospira biflexa]TGM47339.1 enoyl-CoA hydratase/isomerase family protein [Leptospira biflexa]TGM50195.1 enoyl-CoA hydratase/isomerase family protein [Leptospira biflexa]
MTPFAEIFHGDRILEIKMQSNEKNTFDFEAFVLFQQILNKHANNPNLRVLLFTSAQTQFFSNGIEPTLMYGKTESDVRRSVEQLLRTAQTYFHFPVPTIAVINGHCMAAGAVFALFSDYRYMVDKGGRIGFSEAIVGLNFPSIPTIVLQDLVGVKAARDLLFTGKQIKGPEAKEIGLVDELCNAEDLYPEAMKFAETLSKLTDNSSRGMKTALREPYRAQMESLFALDADLFTKVILSPDGQEGFGSLIEKRRPKFTT